MKVEPVKKPVQLRQKKSSLNKRLNFLIEVDRLVRASIARRHFNVSGKGFKVAVLDTGLRTTHLDFKNRIFKTFNFTGIPRGKNKYVEDKHGHGTNVTGIICANGIHIGIAPESEIIVCKVLYDSGEGEFNFIAKALDFILKNNSSLDISTICISIEDGNNHISDSFFNSDRIRKLIYELAKIKVATVISAGNGYFKHHSQQGMAFPAILRDSISAGAVYDSDIGHFNYDDGAQTIESGPNRITPFSQRLHPSFNNNSFTTVFAPGSLVQSSGINNDRGISIQQGTSQAAPVVAGIVLLIQEYMMRVFNEKPSINLIKEILIRGGVNIIDGDDEVDNVKHTGLKFKRADALGSLQYINYLKNKHMFHDNMI